MEFTGKSMKFKKWLACFEEVELPIGDLARDFRDDDNLPNTNDYEILLSYVEDLENETITNVFKSVWKYYSESPS